MVIAQSTERLPVSTTVIVSVVLLVSGAALLETARRARAGRLPRNRWAGIRVSATMAGDAAWEAGHRAAAPALAVAGVVSLAGGVVVLLRLAARPTALTLGGVIVGLLAAVLTATVVAIRAARRAG